jgi:hypothetical protein
MVRNITEVKGLGLSLQDFPLHDPVGDLLFLLQAQRTTIEDAKSAKLQTADRNPESNYPK